MVRIALITLAVLWSTASAAHETWILPSSFEMKPGTAFEAVLSTGSQFPKAQVGTAPDDVVYTRLRHQGKVLELTDRSRGEHLLQLRGPELHTSVGVAYALLPPASVQLSLTQVAQYFDEVGANATTRAAWAAQRRQQARWSETFTKQAKTCIRVARRTDKPVHDNNCLRPVGLPLEIVPLDSVFGLHTGQALRVRVLWQGQPLVDASVGVMTEGDEQRKFFTTDTQGIAQLDLERAGRTLIFSVHLRPTDTLGQWLSDFSTLTVPVTAPITAP